MATLRIQRGAVAAAAVTSASGLRTCPACSRQVSRNAPACPGCGEPFQEAARRPHGAINPRDPVHAAGIVIAVVIVVAAMGFVALRVYDASDRQMEIIRIQGDNAAARVQSMQDAYARQQASLQRDAAAAARALQAEADMAAAVRARDLAAIDLAEAKELYGVDDPLVREQIKARFRTLRVARQTR
jgi:hypothetical protein